MDSFCTHLPYAYRDDNGQLVTQLMPVYIMAAAPKCCRSTGLHRAVFESTPAVYDHYLHLQDDMESGTILPPAGPVRAQRIPGDDLPLGPHTTPTPTLPSSTPVGVSFFADANVSHVEERPISNGRDASFNRVLKQMQESYEASHSIGAKTTSSDSDEPSHDLLVSPAETDDVRAEMEELKRPVQDYLNGMTGWDTMKRALHQIVFEEDPMPTPYQQTEFQQEDLVQPEVQMPAYCERYATSPMPMIRPTSDAESGTAVPTLHASIEDTTSSWASLDLALVGMDQDSTATLPVPCSCEAVEQAGTHLPCCPSWEIIA